MTWADAELIALRESREVIQIEGKQLTYYGAYVVGSFIQERIDRMQETMRQILGNAGFQLLVSSELIEALKQRQDSNSCILIDGSLLGGRYQTIVDDM